MDNTSLRLRNNVAFKFVHHFVSHDIQQRSVAWLSGEISVLADEASWTPKERLYGLGVGEIAELAAREVWISSGPSPHRTVLCP